MYILRVVKHILQCILNGVLKLMYYLKNLFGSYNQDHVKQIIRQRRDAWSPYFMYRRNIPFQGDVVECYHLLRKVRDTSFGLVYQGYDEEYGDECVVKVVPFVVDRQTGEKEVRRRVREAEAQGKLYHRNVEEILDLIVYPTCLVLVFRATKGMVPLSEIDFLWEEDEVRQIAKPVLDSLCYMHSLGIIHNDISKDSISISKNGKVLVHDFDFADILECLQREAPASGDWNALSDRWPGFQRDRQMLGLLLVELFWGNTFEFHPGDYRTNVQNFSKLGEISGRHASPTFINFLSRLLDTADRFALSRMKLHFWL